MAGKAASLPTARRVAGQDNGGKPAITLTRKPRTGAGLYLTATWCHGAGSMRQQPTRTPESGGTRRWCQS